MSADNANGRPREADECLVPVIVYLGDGGDGPADTGEALATGLVPAVGAGVRSVLDCLGIPGRPWVELQWEPRPELAVSVHGVRLGCPHALQRRVCETMRAPGPREECRTLLVRCVLQTVRGQPEHLLGADQAAVFLKGWQDRQARSTDAAAGRGTLTPQGLQRVLCAVVKAGVSLRHSEEAFAIISEGLGARLGETALAELVIARLRPQNVGIELSRKHRQVLLDELARMGIPGEMDGGDERLREQFAGWLRGVLDPLGVRFGDVRLEEAPVGQEVALRINHLAGAALEGQPRPEGGTTLRSTQEALEPELRARAALLLDVAAVELELARSYDQAPQLCLAALEVVSPARLTRILRCLLREGIPIRDLRTILERVASHDPVAVDAADYRVMDDRLAVPDGLPADTWQEPEDYAQQVRLGLKQFLSYQFADYRRRLAVYRLSDDVERRVFDDLAHRRGDAARPPLRPEEARAFREAIAAALADGPTAPLLTTSAVRFAVRRLIADEFPELPVLAEEELIPEVKLGVVGTISLGLAPVAAPSAVPV
jgi:hypothetical protein